MSADVPDDIPVVPGPAGDRSRVVALHDRQLAGALALVAAVVLVALAGIPGEQGLEPAMLPGAIAVGLLAAAAALAVRNRQLEGVVLGDLGASAVFFALLAGAALLLEPVGAPVCIAIFVALELLLLHRRSPWFALLSGVLAAAVVHLVFVALLTVRLPLGWLEVWLR